MEEFTSRPYTFEITRYFMHKARSFTIAILKKSNILDCKEYADVFYRVVILSLAF